MPRFVILRHEMPSGDARASHWDFMVEHDGVLKTWALESEPGASVATIDAMQLADHRLAYLEYEGEVSGNRGSVRRVEQGGYSVLQQSDARWLIELRGERLNGAVELTQTENAQRWRFAFTPAADTFVRSSSRDSAKPSESSR